MMKIERWELALTTDDGKRRSLENPPPYESIVEDIRVGMQVLCCHRDQSQDHRRFERVTYCITVPKKLFDLFFNSRNGYRACYYISPYNGLRANDLFMHLLYPSLAAASQTENSTLSSKFIRESLTSPSSKVWLAECSKEVCLTCQGCKGEWSTGQGNLSNHEIMNNRWERGAGVLSGWGSKAPYLTKLRIHGAFLDDQHNVFIPAPKRDRAKQIHEFGWS